VEEVIDSDEEDARLDALFVARLGIEDEDDGRIVEDDAPEVRARDDKRQLAINAPWQIHKPARFVPKANPKSSNSNKSSSSAIPKSTKTWAPEEDKELLELFERHVTFFLSLARCWILTCANSEGTKQESLTKRVYCQ